MHLTFNASIFDRYSLDVAFILHVVQLCMNFCFFWSIFIRLHMHHVVLLCSWIHHYYRQSTIMLSKSNKASLKFWNLGNYHKCLFEILCNFCNALLNDPDSVQMSPPTWDLLLNTPKRESDKKATDGENSTQWYSLYDRDMWGYNGNVAQSFYSLQRLLASTLCIHTRGHKNEARNLLISSFHGFLKTLFRYISRYQAYVSEHVL